MKHYINIIVYMYRNKHYFKIYYKGNKMKKQKIEILQDRIEVSTIDSEELEIKLWHKIFFIFWILAILLAGYFDSQILEKINL